MQEIAAFLLGRAQILLDGVRVSLPFKQAEALLYYLLVEGRTSRFKLADLIWGDRGDERKARSNMRNAIYVLRKAFGANFLLETQKNVIEINPQYTVQVDLTHFLQDKNGPVEEYPGDFLEEFYLKDNEYFNEWVLSVRQNYNRVYLERLKGEILRSFEGQQWVRCEVCCLRLLELDEYDEAVYCHLMELYRMRGEYSKATALYARLQKLFSEELFQAPGREATHIMESIKQVRNQRVSEMISQHTLLEQQTAVEELFFGREKEREVLAETVNDFLRGRKTGSLVVLGETGIGKTFLVENVLRRMEAAGELRYFQTRCYRAEEKYALKPWQGIFALLISFFQERFPKQDSAPFVEVVSNVFPFFRQGGGGSIEQDEIATLRYNNSERVIAHLLAQLAQKQKLVFFFDDLQWADNITVSLIQNILTSEQNRNILFLFTCKSDKRPQIDRFLEDMALPRLLKKLTLERFTFEETIQLAKRLLPDRFTSREMEERFYRETDGNPFFIIETANSIRHNGSMADITPNIRDSIYARVMLLSPECRNILNLLSIFFDGATFDLLLELSNREEYELIEILETLIARQLIQETVQPEGVKFQFTHQKILEYVYGELSLTKKQILHHKTACCLEDKLKNNDSDLLLYSKLMYHFQRSRDQKKYLKYYVEYVYSYLNRSHEYYPIITDITDVSEPWADTPDIACTDSEGISRILHDIRTQVNRSLDSLSEKDCQGFLSDYYHMMGRYYIRKVEYDKGLHYVHKLLNINRGVESQRCHTNMIKANRQLMCVYLNRYETHNMRRVIQESFGLLDSIYKAEEAAIWLRLSGLCNIMSGNIPEGIEELERAIAIFEGSEEKERYLYNLAASYAWLGEAERSQMNYPKAMAYYDQAITICEDHYLVGGTATFYTYAGQAALDSGDLTAAERYLSLAVRQFSAVELMWGRGVAFGYYGLLCVKRGNYQMAFDYLTKAECFSQRLESCYEQGMLNRIYASIVLDMDTIPKLRFIFGGYLDQKAEVYVRRARKLLREVYSPVEQMYLDEIERTIQSTKGQ